MRRVGLAVVAGVAFGCGAGSTPIRLEESGALFVGGRPAQLEDLRSLKRPGVKYDLEPVALDLPPSMTFRRAGDLLAAVIAGAGKFHVALRVGSSEATLPLPMDHGCAGVPHRSQVGEPGPRRGQSEGRTVNSAEAARGPAKERFHGARGSSWAVQALGHRRR